VKLAAPIGGTLRTILKSSDFELKSMKQIAKFIMNSNIHIQHNQKEGSGLISNHSTFQNTKRQFSLSFFNGESLRSLARMYVGSDE
jgi:hypothetical protein